MSVTGIFFDSEKVETWQVRELRYCQCCGKLSALRVGQKYCCTCGRNLLELDPIDIMIAEMVKEQENLLQRKYLAKRLNEQVQ